MKHSHMLVLAFSSLLLSVPAPALEMTARSRNVQDNAWFEMRLTAAIAPLQAVINQLLACNNKSMIYASDTTHPGRDADGCVGVSGEAAPAGMVAAFNNATCPTGWAPLAAARDRVMIGSGGSFPLGTTGGGPTVTITRANLPAVRLPIYAYEYVGSDDAASGNNATDLRPLLANRQLRSSSQNGGLGANIYSQTDFLGSGAPLNVTPPYVAMNICYKL